MPLFAAAATIALAALTPLHAQSQQPTFEVASIKRHQGGGLIMFRAQPGGIFEVKNLPLTVLIQFAYNIRRVQIAGGPGWISSQTLDVDAKPDTAGGDIQNMSFEQREALKDQQRLRVQNLLADRFHLKLHRETKEILVYALVVAKNGPKLHGSSGPGRIMIAKGQVSAEHNKLSFLAEALSDQLGRVVIDRTGLTGFYDFTLHWTPDATPDAKATSPDSAPDASPPPESSGPSLFTAIQEQLNLKLEPSKGPVEILVIDHVEQPSEN